MSEPTPVEPEAAAADAQLGESVVADPSRAVEVDLPLISHPAARIVAYVGVVVVAVVAIGAWAVGSPAQAAPDGSFHLASIWCRSAAGAEQCSEVRVRAGEQADKYAVTSVGEIAYRIPRLELNCFGSQPTVSAVCPVAADVVVRASDWLYPPLFYDFAAMFADADINGPMLAARLAVTVSVVLIFTLAYLVSLRWLRGAMVVSWIICSMPLGMSLYSSLNPSAWAVAGIAAMWGPMVTAYYSPTLRRLIAAVAVWVLAATMAAGARGDGAAYAALVTGLGLVALLWRAPRKLVPALASVATIAICAYFFLTSGQSKVASTSFAEGQWRLLDRPVTDQTVWSSIESIPTMWSSLTGAPWGGGRLLSSLGQFDTPVPTGAWMVTTLVLGGFVLAGLAVVFKRKTAALLLLLAATIVIPVRSLIQARSLVGDLFQPRYLMPLLIVIVGVALLARNGRRIRFGWGQLIVVWVGLSYAGTVALHAWIRRFVSGTSIVDWDLDLHVRWWDAAISPNAAWILGSLAWAALVAVAVIHVRPLPIVTPAEAAAVEQPPTTTEGAGSEEAATEGEAVEQPA